MKKFLSLVLALTMAMSLVTISAGAKDFTDDSKITYKEAVDVVSSLDIVDGYTDGSFNPTNTLTRGAAAKIICNLILGPTTADALSADTAPFKDVPVTNEFAGYIAYCSQQGIISGYADGTFRPAGTLTGYAFMKMLLGALGYSAEVEDYTGANWSVAVAKQAVGIGLDDGNDEFVGVKAVTREEACLYAFNTLTADMVEYDTTTTIDINGATVVMGGSKASVVYNSERKDYRTSSDDRDEVMQFCEKYFTDLELRSDAATDSFGRPSNTWYNDNDKIGTYAKEADVVYTADVKSKDIYADLDLSDAYNYDVVVDGQESANDFVVAKRDNQDGYDGVDPDDKIADQIGDVLGNGSLIEVYKDEQVITVVNTYIMQVNGDYDKDEEELTLATVDGAKEPDVSDDVLSSDDFDNLDAYEDEEYVLVTVADGVIKSIAKAEQVTATVTEYVEDDTVTAGGTEYKYAYGNDNTDGTYELKTDYDLYLDAYGYVIYADGVEDETNYVYVYEFGTSSGLSTTSKVLAYGFFLDGTDDEITINKVDGDKVTGENYASKTDDGQWYKYRLKEDGKYDLTSVANVGDGSVATDTKITNYDESVNIRYNGGSLKGNASTVFVIREDDGDVKVYTGIKNVADITSTAGDTEVTIFTDGSTTYAKYVFIDLQGGKMSGGSNSSDVVFVVDLDKKGTDADDNEYYRYDAILNGEVKQVKFEDSLNVGYLYNEVEYDDNGYVTSCDPVVTTDDDYYYDTVTNAKVSQKSSTITISDVGSNEGFYMASGAKIFVIDGDDVSTYTAKKLANEYEDGGLNARVTGVVNADGEYSYLYIYLV